MPDKALVLFPGVSFAKEDSALRSMLLPQLQQYALSKGAQISCNFLMNGAIEFRYTCGGRSELLDLYEVPWQNGIQTLSTLSWVSQIVLGLPELTATCLRAIKNVVARPRYFFVTLGAFLAILLWLYATLAVAVPALRAEAHRDFPGISTFLDTHGAHSVRVMLSGLFDNINIQSRLFIVAVGFLTIVFNMSYKNVVDVIDLYVRYFKSYSLVGKTYLRASLLDRCDLWCQALICSGYKEIVIVGHSFGTILAMDWVAHTTVVPTANTSISLVTLGSFVQYLRRDWPVECTDLIEGCLKQETLVSWHDFFSARDFISSTEPLTRDDSKYVPHFEALESVNNIERFGVGAHAAYYSDPSVLSLLLGINMGSRGASVAHDAPQGGRNG